MKKLLFTALFLGVSYLCKPSEPQIIYIAEAKGLYQVPEKAEIQFDLFKQHLGLIESNNRYQIINRKGYMGKYQFGAETLDFLGYHGITPETFKANPGIFPPSMQEQALKDLIRFNEKALSKYKHYIGTVINGVRITKAGLMAAAHLAGAGGVQHYLTSNHNATDCNGSSIQSYLQEFSNFNI
jgi:hypothetical protein